jgi:hypothetical protein
MKEMLNYYGGTPNKEKKMEYLNTLLILPNEGILTENGLILEVMLVCDPFSRAPHRLWAMGCGRRTRRSLPSVHLFNAS